MTASGREDGQSDLRERLRAAYARRGHDLVAFAYRLSGSAAMAEDAVHDAFVRVLDGRCRVDLRRGSLDTLLFGVVRNVIREHRRRGARDDLHRSAEERERPASERSEPADVLAVRGALDRLSDTEREIIVLAEYHGLTPTEIAAAFGVSAVVVRVRLHRARRRLRQVLLAPPPAASLSLSRRPGHGR